MQTKKEAALALHDLNYIPILIPPGEKGPRGSQWQKVRYSREIIESRLENNPAMNVGILLGQSASPEVPAPIDLECDGEQAEADYAELTSGCDMPQTPTWQARRGLHRLFATNARLLELGAVVKYKTLEIRLGGKKAAQSLLPPSETDSYTREWIVPLSADCLPAKLPDAVVQKILIANSKAVRGPVSKLGNSPGDEFCRRATWKELLEPAGWTNVGQSDGVEHWRRPGKEQGSPSATAGFCESEAGRDLLYVFSTNAAPLENGKSYSKFAAFTILHHAGDFKAAASALAKQGYGKPKRPPSASTRLIDLAADAELFHTPAGDSYATVKVGEHRETYAVDSRAFKRYLEHRFYQHSKFAPPAKALTEAIGVISAGARYDGKELPVFTRVASHADAIYLDLANEKWEAIEIRPDGISVVAQPPVKFRRPNGMLALPYPQPGNIDELRQFVNVDDDSWLMLVSFLVAALRPSGPFPIGLFNSEHGSCKSTTMRICRQTIDPNTADLRAAPDSVQTLMLAATNGRFVTIDNSSGVQPWLSDALCRISTGGGLGTRTLYTNGEETLFDVQRPVMVTGIAELTSREDFLDRAVIIRCPEMPEHKRKDEQKFYAAFNEARPRILGALLTAASAALRNLPTTRLERLPRMADFALWASAAESGFGWQPGTFMGAYDRNRAEANEAALDNPIADAIRNLLSISPRWSGNAEPLLQALNENSTPEMRQQDSWPRSGNALSGKLNRMKPNLRKAGILVEKHRRDITLSLSA